MDNLVVDLRLWIEFCFEFSHHTFFEGEFVPGGANSSAVGATKDGVYGQTPASTFKVRDDNDNHDDGDIIEFYIEDIKVAEFPFEKGGSDPLDLSITGIVEPS